MSKEDRSAGFSRFVLSALVGGCIVPAMAIVLLLLCAAMISAGMLGQTVGTSPVIGGCVRGGLSGGIFTGVRWGRRRLAAGLTAAAIGFLLLLLIRFVFFDAADAWWNAPGIPAGCLCGGAISGLLPGGKKKKKKRR